MDTKQPQIVIKNYGCGSGCGTVFAAFLILIVIGIAMSNFNKHTKTTLSTQQNQRTKGLVSRDLPPQLPNFGTLQETKELLQLINDVTNKTEYRISYKINETSVVFGADFELDVIARINGMPDGKGTFEKWAGNIIYRLEQGAKGESLNNTPNGQSPSHYQSF
jgi:hypothetical protein